MKVCVDDMLGRCKKLWDDYCREKLHSRQEYSQISADTTDSIVKKLDIRLREVSDLANIVHILHIVV